MRIIKSKLGNKIIIKYNSFIYADIRIHRKLINVKLYNKSFIMLEIKLTKFMIKRITEFLNGCWDYDKKLAHKN